MMKKTCLFALVVIWGILVGAEDDGKILSINDSSLFYSQIVMDQDIANKIFEMKYGRIAQNNDGDLLLIRELRKRYESGRLYVAVLKIIRQQIQKQLVPSTEIIDKYRKKATAMNAMPRTLALLTAYEEVNQSDHADRYEIAYEKYLKGKDENGANFCPYNFFKGSNKPEYVKFLKTELDLYQKEGLGSAEKYFMMEEVLNNYIIEQISQDDDEIKSHVLLSKKHHCDFVEKMQLKWILQQVKTMDIKIYDTQYGSSIKQIIENGMKAQMQLL